MGHNFTTCNSCDGVTNWDDPNHKFCYQCDSMFCGSCNEKFQLFDEEEYEQDEDGLQECPLCLNEIVTDFEMLNWLLAKCNLTRDQAEEQMRRRSDVAVEAAPAMSKEELDATVAWILSEPELKTEMIK